MSVEAATPDSVDVDGGAYARRLRNSLIGLIALIVVVAGLLLALPGLDVIERQLAHASLGWVFAAIGFEYLSCIGYVLTVMLAFPRGRIRAVARLGWAELAANSVLPAGGLGGLGLGAWILRRRGVPAARIARRSTVVFVLTSAVNVVFLVVVGLALAAGVVNGPRSPLLTLLPAAIGLAAVALTLGGARAAGRFAASSQRKRLASVLGTVARGIDDTVDELRHHDWRLVGPVAYFLFDVAALAASFAATSRTPAIAAVVMAHLIGQMAGIVPIPGGVGAVDGGLVGALVLYGVNFDQAAAAVLVYRAISLTLPAVLGTIAFLLLRRHLDDPVVLRSGPTGAA
ncbi:MAG: lysylphosphatidylglycerol synthase transmembrane domain-containing protein [Solirubrobacteraceae bacterium]